MRSVAVERIFYRTLAINKKMEMIGVMTVVIYHLRAISQDGSPAFYVRRTLSVVVVTGVW